MRDTDDGRSSNAREPMPKLFRRLAEGDPGDGGEGVGGVEGEVGVTRALSNRRDGEG